MRPVIRVSAVKLEWLWPDDAKASGSGCAVQLIWDNRNTIQVWADCGNQYITACDQLSCSTRRFGARYLIGRNNAFCILVYGA